MTLNISGTFVVSTIDDPVGLVAQYAPNNNPSNSQIHTSFQDGDMYMRTRTTEEAFSGNVDPNHPWNRIVGESGGETDYSFAISAYTVNASGNVQNPPQDLNPYSAAQWSDAPVATTVAKPYLWTRIQKKDGNGNSVGNASYVRMTGEDGASPILADLDNEMDSVRCDASGNTVGEQSVTTTFSFYKGNTKQTQAFKTITCSIGGYALSTEYIDDDPSPRRNFKAVPNLTTGTVVVSVKGDVNVGKVDVVCTPVMTIDGVDETRNMTLTINGVRDGEDGTPATIYNIVPQRSSIPVGRTEDGGYSLRYQTLRVGYTKSVGDTITVVPDATSTIDSKYRIFFRRRLRETGEFETNTSGNAVYYSYTYASYRRRLVVTDGYEDSGLDTETYDMVLFYLYPSTANSITSPTGSKIIDRETVPVIADGEKGEDGYTVQAQYAPNNNPSESQIHTTWQDGDLYMRTKQSNETTWSSWHKIVGESGDETDYTFNISQSLTSSSATTAPANCYYGTWQDSPIATTSTYPYLWMKIVKKTWNSATQSYDSGTASYSRVTGENAVLQELLPSSDQISFARTESGGLTPSSRSLSLSIKKTDGGNSSIQNIGNSGLTIRWSSATMPSTSSSGYGWGNGTETGITWNNITMQIANTVVANNINIAAFNSDGTLVSQKTISIVRDGNNGNDGISYDIVFTKAAAVVNDSIVTAELSGYAYKYVGGVRNTLQSTTIRFGYILTDSDTYALTTTNNNGFFDAGTWFNGDDISVYGKNSPSIFAAIIIDSVVVHAQMIPISVNGSDGQRGKVGRFFYYATDWNPNDDTQQWSATDAEAPYFRVGTSYYVFVGEYNFTNKTMSWINDNLGAPSASNPNFQIMQNDWKYLITEAIFGSYAHLGSFIVNDDWLISQYGTINGVSSSEYTKFYPEFAKGCTLCKNFGVTVSYVNAGYATFIGGKTYYIKVSGSDFSSDSQLNVRMNNGSSNVGTTIYLTSSSPSGTITFAPASTGTYYIRADMSVGGQTANLTAYVECFVPNYAVDGNSGNSYQMRVYASGGIRSPFTYIDDRADHNIFNATMNDNVALYTTYEQWGSGTHYVLPWDASQSGRKVCVTNYKWNGVEQPTTGYAIIDSESGKYFYEDGIKKNALTLSREGVELLGFGTQEEFYGWIVIKRFDLVTENKYGRNLKALAIGRYTHSNNTFSYKTFDGSQLTFSKVSTGIYRIYYDKNKNWFDLPDNLTAMITPLGEPIFVYLKNVQNAPASGNPYFEIYSQTTSINNGSITYSYKDGSFDVIITNSNDWLNVQYETT